MNAKICVTLIVTMAMSMPLMARVKKHPDRALIEQMEAVPCGATEKGLTGLGSIFASVGVTKVNTNEKLCPEYLLRTDDMEYHVRPLDRKHLILPVGHEGELKISHNIIKMKIVDGDHHMRAYQITSMKQIDHPNAAAIEPVKQNVNYPQRPIADKSYTDRNSVTPVNNSPHN